MIFVSQDYAQYEDSHLWKLLDRTIATLETHQDLQIRTTRRLVLGFLCQALEPLRNGGSIHVATIWRWLRERSWPANSSDDDRLELARDIVRVGGAGTVDHLALFLRDTLPTVQASTIPDVAAQLIDTLARSQTESGAGAF